MERSGTLLVPGGRGSEASESGTQPPRFLDIYDGLQAQRAHRLNARGVIQQVPKRFFLVVDSLPRPSRHFLADEVDLFDFRDARVGRIHARL